MSKNELLQLSKEELVGLTEVYSRLYTALDGLWFLSVEEEYGHVFVPFRSLGLYESWMKAAYR